MKLLYLPLDSRPCNMVFPVQMAQWAGADIVTPPLNVMDCYTRPTAWENIRDFLEREAGEADALAISIDQLCYGSLLASREADVSLGEALERLAFLQDIHEKYPGKPIHAFSVILRSTISTLRLSDLSVYRAVTAYSQASDRYAVMRQERDRKMMEEAEAAIPPKTMEQVREVRRRNHRVNLRCLEWRREEVLTSLMLLMEDSQPYGFHRTEQRVLVQRMDGLHDVWLHNGADEGGCMAVAKALGGEPAEISVRWIGRTDGRFVAKFEDRPFVQNVRDNMMYLGMRETENADIVLAIPSPVNGQQGDFHESDFQPDPDALRKMAAEINGFIGAGKKVYLLDQLCANGGSPELLQAVHADGLAGYSAWNTATNAMGTILAQIATDAMAGEANRCFRNERFMDDMIYEAVLRRPLDLELAQKGDDPYHLSDPAATEAEINRRYRALMRDPNYAGTAEAIRTTGCGYMTLPWPRTFEIQAHHEDRSDETR